ncbi:MAG: acylphosphatase [Methanomicrobiales archaeon]|nr:acylphosphatase [Methanomicrobiales archaeon]MDI6877298.1 acylphosphatase [Methanomicrobiales archaeon]
MPELMQRAVISVSGRVQGVGYRAYVQDLARGMRLTGYVRNLPDGSVRVLAEGEEGQLRRFLDALWVRGDPLIRVRSVDVEWSEASGSYTDFRIQYRARPL